MSKTGTTQTCSAAVTADGRVCSAIGARGQASARDARLLGMFLLGLSPDGGNNVIENHRNHHRTRLPAVCGMAGITWGHRRGARNADARLPISYRAWQHHFSVIFGLEALSRVRGLSPAEMALPNHPDVLMNS